jgi:hypothetical protein
MIRYLRYSLSSVCVSRRHCKITYCGNMCTGVPLDMGCGEADDSFFIEEDIQPDSMNTTSLIYSDHLDDLSFVFHIGDMSYARGFSAVVSTGGGGVEVGGGGGGGVHRNGGVEWGYRREWGGRGGSGR